MLEEVHARSMHRRLKARFSPTQLFTITPSPESNSPAATDSPTNPPANTPPPASSSPAPVSVGPGPASQQQSTSATSSSASATSNAQSTSTSSTSATTSSSATSSSSSSTTSSSSSSSSSSASAGSSSSTLSTPSSTPTQAQGGGLGASIPVVTNHGQSTQYIYSSLSASPTSALSSASNSASADNANSGSSSVSAPVVIGIVVAIIGGLVGIVFAVTYFMRRSGRDEEEDILRRQSMFLPDEPTPRGFSPGRGVTPRPPSTLDPHMTGGPVSFGGQQQYVDQGYHGSSYQGNFGPGQVIPMPPQAWAPNTPHSSQPFFQPMGETPLGSPVTPVAYDYAYSAQGQFAQQQTVDTGAYLERHGSNGADYMLNRQGSNGADYMLGRQGSTSADYMLSRQGSSGADYVLNRQGSSGPDFALSRQDTLSPISPVRQGSLGLTTPSRQNSTTSNVPLSLQPGGASGFLTRQSSMTATAVQLDIPETDYVDLNRSSVSPFQAAQYAEISDRLQTAPPMPLATPLVAAAADEAIMKEDQVVPSVTQPRPLNVNAQGKAVSPVASPVLGSAPGAFFMSPVEEVGPSPFSDPHFEEHSAQIVNPGDLPRPPSPAYSSKSRINSTPPKLPEFSPKDSLFSPVTLEFPSLPAARGPSPLSAEVVPPVGTHAAEAKPEPVRRFTKDTPAARPPSTYTVYDDDDAYAGI